MAGLLGRSNPLPDRLLEGGRQIFIVGPAFSVLVEACVIPRKFFRCRGILKGGTHLWVMVMGSLDVVPGGRVVMVSAALRRSCAAVATGAS